jgi:hypothetical protein
MNSARSQELLNPKIRWSGSHQAPGVKPND